LAARIRLKRVGAKKNPHYRIVVMHSTKPRDGAAVEELGHYDPRQAEPRPVFPDPDRALHWLMTGAQPTETVRSLLRKAGIWAKFAELRAAKPTADEGAATA
jgi:small subunit ribosomal protein S16